MCVTLCSKHTRALCVIGGGGHMCVTLCSRHTRALCVIGGGGHMCVTLCSKHTRARLLRMCLRPPIRCSITLLVRHELILGHELGL